MKVQISDFLKSKKELLKKLIEVLSETLDYVSILGTDVSGKKIGVSSSGINVEDAILCERGFVLRAYNGKNYFEHSFNNLSESNFNEIVEHIVCASKNSMNGLDAVSYPLITEDAIAKSFCGEVNIDPMSYGDDRIIESLGKIKETTEKQNDNIVNVQTGYDYKLHCKMFISVNKDLEQAFITSESSLLVVMNKDGDMKYAFESVSGLKGIEGLEELTDKITSAVARASELLGAGHVEPGVYDVICAPTISGLIAHEAFGHGVEMDMFVKNRAKGAHYIGKDIASPLTNMRDGAAAVKEIGTYFFDDEGTLASDTKIINNGVLKTGISDILSATKLGTPPTGNGRRESFERKAYSRMTNTFFDYGVDKLEDMIASVKNGYLLENMMGGMEDPKNWGIQCIAQVGRKIKDGKLTGEIISPVIMTGYVPELLKNISMVSGKLDFNGSGACGKGHKELVKVSCGGPYIKTKVRLG